MIKLLSVITDDLNNVSEAITNDFPTKESSKYAVLVNLDNVVDIIKQMNDELEKRQLNEDYEATGGNYDSFADFIADRNKNA